MQFIFTHRELGEEIFSKSYSLVQRQSLEINLDRIEDCPPSLRASGQVAANGLIAGNTTQIVNLNIGDLEYLKKSSSDQSGTIYIGSQIYLPNIITGAEFFSWTIAISNPEQRVTTGKMHFIDRNGETIFEKAFTLICIGN